MEIIPFIPKCEFEIGGAMDFIGKVQPNAKLYQIYQLKITVALYFCIKTIFGVNNFMFYRP